MSPRRIGEARNAKLVPELWKELREHITCELLTKIEDTAFATFPIAYRKALSDALWDHTVPGTKFLAQVNDEYITERVLRRRGFITIDGLIDYEHRWGGRMTTGPSSICAYTNVFLEDSLVDSLTFGLYAHFKIRLKRLRVIYRDVGGSYLYNGVVFSLFYHSYAEKEDTGG